MINQKCIRNHAIDLSFARTHSPKSVNDKWLQYGDLLINSTGDGTLGRAAQVWFAPNNMTVDSHVTIVRPKTSDLIFYIGLWGLLHEREIELLHTGSTGQTELPRDRIKAMELILPDNEILRKFNCLTFSSFALLLFVISIIFRVFLQPILYTGLSFFGRVIAHNIIRSVFFVD